MPKKSNHIHRYKRINLATLPGKVYLVFRCIDPVCTNYIPISLALGKACICNRCGNVMTITNETLTGSGDKPHLYPHCSNCIKRRKPSVDAIAEYITKVKPVP